MPAPRNLAGLSFGLLTVRKMLPERDHFGHRLWECKCQCGRITAVDTGSLTSGNTKSCGCQKRQSKKPHDLTGRVFGKLTALRLLEKKTRHGKRLWRSRCECGREATVAANQLTTGKTKSCGCLHKLTKARAQAEHKDTVPDEQGVPYYAPRLAARILRVNITTFYRGNHRPGWKTSCPHNDGKGLPTKLLPNALGRKFEHFHGPTIDRVKQAMAETMLFPKVPEHVYIEDACKEIGCDRRTLDRRLAGARVKKKKVVAKGADGHLRRRTYIPKWFVDRQAAPTPLSDQVLAADPAAAPQPLPNDQAEEAPRRRGRPKGSLDSEVGERKAKMLEAWARGEFGTNKAAAARAWEFDRSDATKIINEYESRKM